MGDEIIQLLVSWSAVAVGSLLAFLSGPINAGLLVFALPLCEMRLSELGNINLPLIVRPTPSSRWRRPVSGEGGQSRQAPTDVYGWPSSSSADCGRLRAHSGCDGLLLAAIVSLAGSAAGYQGICSGLAES